jgi:hypothetical protein
MEFHAKYMEKKIAVIIKSHDTITYDKSSELCEDSMRGRGR